MLLECFAALGKHAVRDDELRRRAEGKAEPEKETIVARIGEEPISAGELRGEIERQARAFARFQAGTPDEVEKAVAAAVAEVLKDKDRTTEVLQRMVTSRILYQEALARGLGKGEEVEEAVARFRREWLAQQVVDAHLRENVKITNTDLTNHYQAHRQEYAEPEAVKLSTLAFDSKEAAEASLKEGPTGLEKRSPTKSDTWVTRNDPIPDVGRSGEATAHVFALKQGQWGDRPIQVGEKWYVFRVDERRAERERPLDEVRDRVRADLLRAKRAEQMEVLRKTLESKFRVELVPEGLEAMRGGKTTGAGRGTSGR